MKISDLLAAIGKFVALLSAFQSILVAAYLLWRTQLASRFVGVGTDTVAAGVSSAIVGIGLSLVFLFTSRWKPALFAIAVSSVSLAVVLYLYLSRLACTIKKDPDCESLLIFFFST